jgi:hypothetical protein
MLSIVFGLIAVCLGLWGMVTYWWYIVEVVIAIFPLVLIFTGAVAVLAGIKSTGLMASIKQGNGVKQEEPEVKIRKKDQ